MKHVTWLTVVGALLIGATGANAQNFPNRPLTIMVPNAAGSSSDNFARFFAQELSKGLEAACSGGGQSRRRRNAGRPGSAEASCRRLYDLVGKQLHARRQLQLVQESALRTERFAPVACLYRLPTVLAIREGVPAKTAAELVAYAKANPGKLTYGWSSSTNRMGAELFKARTGTDIQPISYKSPPQVVNDMLGGRLDMVVEAGVTIFPHAEAGTMRILAVSPSTRLKSIPNVPTMEEAGYKDASLTPWSSAYVKAGTPPDIIDKLNAALATVIASPEYTALEAKAMSQSFLCSPAELEKFTTSEIKRWSDLVTLAGIEKQ